MRVCCACVLCIVQRQPPARIHITVRKRSHWHIAGCRAVVCDCVAPAGRMQAMGRLGAACGTGFIFGPAFGGIIAAKHAKSTPPALAAMLFVFCLLLVSSREPS